MVQGVRSSATEVVFDLHSEAGVVAALAAVRASTLSREEKSELRDLVFAFKNEPDTSLEATIQSALSGLTPAQIATPTATPVAAPAATIVTAAPVAAAAPRYGLPHTRPQPVFAPLGATAKVSAAPTPTPVPTPAPTPIPVVPAEPAPAPVLAAEVPSVPPNLPVATSEPEPDLNVIITPPAPTPEPVRIVPVSVVSTDMVPKAVVDEKLAAVAPTPEATIELKPPYQEDHSLDTYRNRITEIKQFINQKVGNPVNLVDLDNTVGRAYMGALLEAMKAVSGGGGDVVTLMAKLEAVVKDVETVLETKLATGAPTPAPAAPAAPAPVAAPVAASPVSVPVKPAVTMPTVDIATAPAIPVPHKAPETTAMSTAPVIAPSIPVRRVEEPMTPITPGDVAQSRFKNVIPVTAQEPLKTPKDLPTAAEVKARSGITDPLSDPDIDLGLEQLLSEWSLFRKSGVFGTGPKGTQHPLYQKLSVLPMPLILSGRFEGSTAEIRQSITDYMNGWRYEQGIIYEQEETLEHYLRRVIRHIIDSQTRRRTA